MLPEGLVHIHPFKGDIPGNYNHQENNVIVWICGKSP